MLFIFLYLGNNNKQLKSNVRRNFNSDFSGALLASNAERFRRIASEKQPLLERCLRPVSQEMVITA